MRTRTLWTTTLTACLLLLGTALAQEADPAPTPPSPPTPAISVTAELADGAKILGQPIDLESLPVKADFGSIKIPLRLLATVESNKERTAVTCRFRNNDTLSAQLEIYTLLIKTSYGEATSPLSRVNKLHFSDAK